MTGKNGNGNSEEKGSEITNEEEIRFLKREMQAFANSISHDFNAPVRRIIGLSQIIIEDHSKGLDETGKKYLNIISSEAMRMQGMIADLLIFSRCSIKELNKTEFDIGEMIDRILKDEKCRMEALEIEGTVSTGVLINGDAEMLEMAMRELIENSLKFAKEGSVRKIEFGQVQTENGKLLFLKDNGVGFDQSHSDKLFKPFQRCHGKEYPGEGMGLAIANLIIMRHGGNLRAESTIDQGTTIYFTIG